MRCSTMLLLAMCAGGTLASCMDESGPRPMAMDVHYDLHYTVCDWHFDRHHRTTHEVLQGAEAVHRDQPSSRRELDRFIAIARKASVHRADIEHPGPHPVQDPAHPYDPFYLIAISISDGTTELRSMPYSWGNPTPDQLALLRILDPRWAGQ